MTTAAGTLSVVSTPIGNLEDITLRALRTLSECDAVVAEDSRRARALLSAHGIAKRILSLPAFDERRRIPSLLQRLYDGEHLALCTDAGTPVVSDPGAALVAAAIDEGMDVRVIPGASAVTAALAGSGLDTSTFTFLGFLPRTPGKMRRVLGAAVDSGHAVVFFEAAVRLPRTLRIAEPLLEGRTVVVARELTKVFETFHRGTCTELIAAFAEKPPRGECTIIIAPP